LETIWAVIHVLNGIYERLEDLSNKACEDELPLVITHPNESFQSALAIVLGDEPRYAMRMCRSRSIGVKDLNDVGMLERTEFVCAGIHDLGPEATKDCSLTYSSLRNHGLRKKQLHNVMVVVLVNKILYNQNSFVERTRDPRKFLLDEPPLTYDIANAVVTLSCRFVDLFLRRLLHLCDLAIRALSGVVVA
jgi:hypothetical protein